MKARRCWKTKSRFGILKERANKKERETERRKGQMDGCVVIYWPLIWLRELRMCEGTYGGDDLWDTVMSGIWLPMRLPAWVTSTFGLPKSLSGPTQTVLASGTWSHGSPVCTRVCPAVCALLNPSTPYISTWWLCAWTYLQLSFHMCACMHMSEIDSRWTKDVQQRKGPAGSNCTEYSVYYQQHNRFKATCSLTVPITVTSYTMEPCNTTKEGGKEQNSFVLKARILYVGPLSLLII